jgi:hypothetical protein
MAFLIAAVFGFWLFGLDQQDEMATLTLRRRPDFSVLLAVKAPEQRFSQQFEKVLIVDTLIAKLGSRDVVRTTPLLKLLSGWVIRFVDPKNAVPG